MYLKPVYILDHERRDECIDITTICAFYCFIFCVIHLLGKMIQFSTLASYMIGK